MPDTDSSFLDALSSVTALSFMSKKTYLAHIYMLQDTGGVHHTIDYVVRHPQHTYDLICNKTDQAKSRVAYINSILTLYRHIPTLAERYPKEHAAWRVHLALEDGNANKRYEKGEPTDRQRAAHVPWADILRARDALPRDSIDYLFMACNTYMVPLRADLDHIAIHYKQPTAPQLKASPNYLLIHKPDMMTIVLNEWKTKTASNPTYSQDLLPVLCSIIAASIARSPRDFLFVQLRNGDPFSSAQAFTLFSRRLLKRVLHNEHASQNTLRHSYISALPDMQPGERDNEARKLGHSPAMSLRYKLNLDGFKKWDPASMTELDTLPTL